MNGHAGTELRRLRESKGLTLEQAARDTCLRPGLLQELEQCAAADELPEIYQKLSLRMYARYLGLDAQVSRRAKKTTSGVRIAPVTNFVRRMGRLPKPSRVDPARPGRLLTIAKTTSAAIVVVLAVGLWSLNAKISRLNFDERPAAPRVEVAQPAPAPAPETAATAPCGLPTLPPLELVRIDESVVLNLAPGLPAPAPDAPLP
jgi:cytoskeletal protein RodZ